MPTCLFSFGVLEFVSRDGQNASLPIVSGLNVAYLLKAKTLRSRKLA
jgi:hypothetical protein